MVISAKDVKRLRDMTGVGMMDCKKALQEAGGDFEKAVEYLRKKGQKVAAKRADRSANEGLILTALTDGNKTGAIAEVNCETDFVARNEDFQAFASNVIELILENQPADLDALNKISLVDGRTVGNYLLDLTAKIGEKMEIRRFKLLKTEDGEIISYIHPGSRLGVLVDVSGTGNLKNVGTDAAMQVAALNPVAARIEEVPEVIKTKELEIAREAAINEGKPEKIVDRIAEGKLKRYYKDHVLIEQPFVKDSSKTVKEMLKQGGVEIHHFVRFALGD